MSTGPTARMDPRYFVRVEVPVLRDDGQDGGGTWCASGTGYPVGADLILTARHVVAPAGRDTNYPIRIRWMSFPNFPAVALLADDQALVWQGPGTHDDVALLHCPERPPEIIVPAWPWAALPPDGARFASQGYPLATVFEDPAGGRPTPTQNSFRGTIRRGAAPWFEIVDEAPPRAADDWQGASGMAIFTDQGLVGVFSAALTRIHGKGHAVPMAPLLAQYPELAGLFPDGFDQHWNECREQARSRVTAALERSSRLRETLAAELGQSAATATTTVVDLLLDLDFDTFAGIAEAVYEPLLERLDRAGRPDSEDLKALEVLRELALHLAPLRYDPQLARTAYVRARGTGLVELPVALYAVAELLVAAQEGRPAAYQRRKKATDDDVRGFACLCAAAPELGIDATTEDYCERLQVHLGCKDATPEGFSRAQFLAHLEGFMKSVFYPKDRPELGASPADDDRSRWAGINRGVATWRTPRGRKVRLYTVFRPGTALEEREMHETALVVHARVSSLRVLFLTAYCNPPDGPHPRDLEADRTDAFVHLLPFDQPAPETPNP